MGDDSDRILGELSSTRYPLASYSGFHATITGCNTTPMRLLASLLIKLDFTVTAQQKGEQDVTFTDRRKHG